MTYEISKSVNTFYEVVNGNSDLTHHGIKGQKWGVRRYQNEDGSLTAAGKERERQSSSNKSLSYKVGEKRLTRRISNMDARVASNLASVRKSRQDSVGLNSLTRAETESALNTPSRVRDVGKRTIIGRTLTASGAAIASGSAFMVSIAAETAMPLAAVPASVIAAGAYWYKSRT